MTPMFLASITSIHFVSSTMSEMKDTNVVGNSESMDQSEDTLHALSSATGGLKLISGSTIVVQARLVPAPR